MKHIIIGLALAVSTLLSLQACSGSSHPQYYFGFKVVDLVTQKTSVTSKQISIPGIAGLSGGPSADILAVYYTGIAGAMLWEGIAAENTTNNVSLKIYRNAYESCYSYNLRVAGQVYTGTCSFPVSAVTVAANADGTYTFTYTGAGVNLGGGYTLGNGSVIRGMKY